MQFNSETNGLDLYSDARYLCGLDETSDTTSYPIKAFTRNANKAMDRATYLILKANGWNIPYDDGNSGSELLDTSNAITGGMTKLAMSVTWLKIARVRIKDQNGNWITLSENPRKAQNDVQLTAPAGVPQTYYILGGYLYFDKPTNYAFANGIEIQFQRGPSYFIYTDTTKTPGFASVFHTYVSMFAAREFCKVNDLENRVAQLNNDIGSPPDLENSEPGSGVEKEIMDYYSMRDADQNVSIRMVREDYGQVALNPGTGTWPDQSSNSPRGF